jgi:uncharacterized protein
VDVLDTTPQDVTAAFWMACHGGQRVPPSSSSTTAPSSTGSVYDHLTPLDAAIRSHATALADWLRRRGAVSATPNGASP